MAGVSGQAGWAIWWDRVGLSLNSMMKGWLGCGKMLPGRGLDKHAEFFDRFGCWPDEVNNLRRDELQSLGVFHEKRRLHKGLHQVRICLSI